MKDYRNCHVGTIREGSQKTLPLRWSVRVSYDSRHYYYNVPEEEKIAVEEWVDLVFWRNSDNYNPECTCPYSITWQPDVIKTGR